MKKANNIARLSGFGNMKRQGGVSMFKVHGFVGNKFKTPKPISDRSGEVFPFHYEYGDAERDRNVLRERQRKQLPDNYYILVDGKQKRIF